MRQYFYLFAAVSCCICGLPALVLGFSLAAAVGSMVLIPVPVLLLLVAALGLGLAAERCASRDF